MFKLIKIQKYKFKEHFLTIPGENKGQIEISSYQFSKKYFSIQRQK